MSIITKVESWAIGYWFITLLLIVLIGWYGFLIAMQIKASTYQFQVDSYGNTYHCNEVISTGYPVVLKDCLEANRIELYNPANVRVK